MNNSVKKIILHIGAEKTGTTTIQEFLAINRDRLYERGVLFPASPGEKNHTRLAVFAANDTRGVCKSLVAKIGHPGLVKFRAETKNSLLEELTRYSSQKEDTVVFSSELIHAQLHTRDELLRLKGLLPAADEIKIIFYIRRQDRAAVSLYSTALKSGWDLQEFCFPNVSGKRLPYRYDYVRAYELWSSVFGAEAVVVRIFDNTEFLNGDLVEDFCFAAGIPFFEDYGKPEIKNPSLDVNGEFVFKCFNQLKKSAVGGYSEEAFQALKCVLVTSFTSDVKMRPSQESARLFFKAFSESNERLRKLAFPGRTVPLFDDDFSDYPLAASSSEDSVNHEKICSTLLMAWLDLAKIR